MDCSTCPPPRWVLTGFLGFAGFDPGRGQAAKSSTVLFLRMPLGVVFPFPSCPTYSKLFEVLEFTMDDCSCPVGI
ncbi:hypothetical protein M413DRAFT_447452 [Hebeloma cylindrosporum]|uniref:Uncharacterized protein n=1 Tax=Hebeloma cylindrosporum TaxID=76867 RepID=A0A0C2XN85_HEBCY|nr:hypothetical protein M413DRAFT_447452 [Hebeloma cylindrosporum h7]